VRIGRRGLAVLAAAGLVLAGCSNGSGGDGGAFTVAYIEPDLTTVPLMAAVEATREAGFEIDTVELAEPELAIEGLANGDYAVSAEATSPALIAIQRGAPIKIVADVVGNQWAVYGGPDVTSCDDLVGRPFGIFSEGAVATAMARSWVAESCTEGEPDYLVIGGSDVRAQALLAGEIDATALEIADRITLADAGDEPNLVVDFGQQLPDLHPQTVYANTEFLVDNAEAAQTLIDALVAEHEAINADPGYLVSLVEQHLPDSVDDLLPEIAAAYVDAGLFEAAALTPENVQGTIDFFVAAGVIEEGLTAEQAADLSFLGQTG
jgi:NitT/TauT family transport system substrate-binding protein